MLLGFVFKNYYIVLGGLWFGWFYFVVVVWVWGYDWFVLMVWCVLYVLVLFICLFSYVFVCYYKRWLVVGLLYVCVGLRVGGFGVIILEFSLLGGVGII